MISGSSGMVGYDERGLRRRAKVGEAGKVGAAENVDMSSIINMGAALGIGGNDIKLRQIDVENR